MMLKMELKEKTKLGRYNTPVSDGKELGVKTWRGALGYSKRELAVHIWSLLYLKGILSPFV